MSLVRLVLPSALVLYFLWRSRRQRIFLLGIPYLMFMSYSVFFDKLKPFWIPGRLSSPADHVMIWLIIVWVLYFDLLLPRRGRTLRERKLFGPSLSLPEELVVIALAAYVILQVGLTAANYVNLESAVVEARPFLYFLAGYFLLRGICCHAGHAETLEFIGAIVVVNTIAAGLFVLHQGLHINIYNLSGAQSVVFMGQRLTRAFYFMPQFLPLAIAFCVAKRKLGIFWLGVLLVTLAALWVSYTRSLLIVALLEITAILGVRLLKGREAWPTVKRALQILTVVGVFVGIALLALPAESHYLLSRLESTTSSGSPLRDANVQSRLSAEQTVYQWIGVDSHLLGAGFVSADQDPHAPMVKNMASDLVWIPTLYRLGLLGVFGLVLLFATATWRAARLSLTGQGDAESLSLILLGVTVGVFAEGFVSWTLLDPARTPLALWFFALLAAEQCRRRAELRHAATATRDKPATLERALGA